MKKHAIIPIFIPHLGCRHDCIFCNQKAITAKQNPLTLNDMRNTIDTWLTTLSKVPTVEVAFYGGSFTAIPIEMQNEYLRVALHYKKLGKIDKIHLSTRPDAINEEILDNLKYYGVDTIELGVQSFDEKVLRLSKRGHNADAVYESASMIKAYDFELGIQLMIGLPGDSPEACLFSARETVKVAPRIARLYPTVVIENTELYDKCLDGSYSPLTEEEAIFRTKEMYKIIDSAGIKIIRVGLKSSDLIAPEALIGGGSFHPAFRQLVEGQIAKEIIEEQLPSVRNHTPEPIKINVYSNAHSFSDMIGNSSCNKKYFLEKYPHLDLSYRLSDSLKDGEFLVKIKEQSHLPLTDTSIQSAGGYFYSKGKHLSKKGCIAMEDNKKAVVTVIGKDTVGILANVSGAVAAANANVIEVSQSVLEGFFCMIMMINISDATQGVEELKQNIAASVPNMKVHLMHEDIFNSMHRI